VNVNHGLIAKTFKEMNSLVCEELGGKATNEEKVQSCLIMQYIIILV